MTRRIAGAWRKCATDGCHQRVMASNTTGQCLKHRWKAYPSPLHREPKEIARTRMYLAWDAAKREGHDLERPQPDGPNAYVARCRGCGGFVAIDLEEEPFAYGRATQGPCPGEWPTPPAERRLTALDQPGDNYWWRPPRDNLPPPLAGPTQEEMADAGWA